VEAFDAELGRYLVQLLPITGPPVLAKLRRENLHIPPALVLRFAGDEPEAPASPEAKEAATTASAGAASPRSAVARSPAPIFTLPSAEAGTNPVPKSKSWRPTLRPM
ncbi:unnamed protein product, partial [Polarella glacialis]